VKIRSSIRFGRFPLIFRLSKAERNVSIFDHVSYLLLHCDDEKNYEIKEQYWPEHGHVENLEKRHHKRREYGFET
jgi:hypothetical protein